MSTAGVGKGSSYLSPPDRKSGLPASAPTTIPLGFFGSILEDPYAADFPAAMIAAVRWTYVPIKGIGSFSASPPIDAGLAKLRADCPDTKLVIAILEDVVSIVHDGRLRFARGIPFPKGSKVTSKHTFYDAVRWVLDLDEMDEGQFSFSGCCRYLDLDPEVVRGALLRGPIEHCHAALLDGRRRRITNQRGHHSIGGKRRKMR